MTIAVIETRRAKTSWAWSRSDESAISSKHFPHSHPKTPRTPHPMTKPSLLELAEALSDRQRAKLLSFQAEPRQMGIGMMQFLPGLVERDGFDHPIFGSHYRLTWRGRELAAAVRAAAALRATEHPHGE